jgi:hypothetical protein
MAVRIELRPRLTLPKERSHKPRRRLPPLALPAVAYWIAMAGLTYAFAHLGEHPLSALEGRDARAAERDELPDERPRSSVPVAEPQLAPAGEAAMAPPANDAAAPAAPAAPDASAPQPEPPPVSAPLAELDSAPAKPRARAAFSEPAARPQRADPAEPALGFPEFKDSSRPAAREHASSGPRIDSLFEPSDRPPEHAAPSAPEAPPPGSDSDSDPREAHVAASCEAAIARYNEVLTLGAPRAPDITRGAYASILENGRYLSACGVPAKTIVEICAAVQNGRAVGITVQTSPADAKLSSCVRRQVMHLGFPHSERLDVTRTRFDR